MNNNLELGKKTHFCPFVYTARHIEQFDYYHPSKGVLVKPCCSLRPSDPRDFALGSDQLEQNLIRMKQQFDAGQWPKECVICHGEERDGLISERLRAFESYFSQEGIERLMKTRRPDNFEMHLKFSNFCNLACRVCNTTESTTYGKIIDVEDPDIFVQQDISNHAEWNYLLRYLKEKLDQNLDSYRFCLVGGETTLTPGVYILDQWLLEHNYVHKIDLVLASNMTHMPDKLLDLFGRYKSVTLSASLDSTHENFHYVRWPATWHKAVQNLNKVLDYQKKYQKNIDIFVTPNFNINNIFYFDDFLDFWNHNEYHGMTVFNLYSPDAFRIDTLPSYIRQHLLTRLMLVRNHAFFKSSKPGAELVLSWLNSTIERLSDDTNANNKKWQRYLAVNAEFDYLTKTDLFYYNSRLGDLMSETDRAYYIKCRNRSQTFRITKHPNVLFDNNSRDWSIIDNESI